jgi:uncharacterized membrane protein SpoIIM required for sporulation
MFNILFNPKKAQRKTSEIILIAIFYASLSILISHWIFPEFASIISVTFTVFACLYITQGILRKDEHEESIYEEKKLLKKHSKSIKFFLALFIGIVIAFSFWTYILNTSHTNELFSLQNKVINQINEVTITGNVINQNSFFKIIISNNFKIIFVSLIISIFYGAGAIFIITWNASIMGYVIGSLTKEKGLALLPIITTKYFLHGIPEMLSYIVIILAGGIIYTSIIKGNFTKKEKRKKLIIDVGILTGISLILMFFAALIEIYISPLI